jgi:transposase
VLPALRKFPEGLRERAVRLVLDVVSKSGSASSACRQVGKQLVWINADTLRRWVKQAQIDAGARTERPRRLYSAGAPCL